MHLKAKVNEYQLAYPAFEDTPKAVIAAVAFSLAMRLCDGNYEEVLNLLADEWRVLHRSGIVPNKPI